MPNPKPAESPFEHNTKLAPILNFLGQLAWPVTTILIVLICRSCETSIGASKVSPSEQTDSTNVTCHDLTPPSTAQYPFGSQFLDLIRGLPRVLAPNSHRSEWSQWHSAHMHGLTPTAVFGLTPTAVLPLRTPSQPKSDCRGDGQFPRDSFPPLPSGCDTRSRCKVLESFPTTGANIVMFAAPM